MCSFKSSDSSLPVGWSSAAPSVGSLQLYTVLLSILMVVRVLVSGMLNAYTIALKWPDKGCEWVLSSLSYPSVLTKRWEYWNASRRGKLIRLGTVILMLMYVGCQDCPSL